MCVKLCAVLLGTQQLASVYVERLACAGSVRVRELQGGAPTPLTIEFTTADTGPMHVEVTPVGDCGIDCVVY